MAFLLPLVAAVHVVHVVVISQVAVSAETGASWRRQIVNGHALMGGAAAALWLLLMVARSRPGGREAVVPALSAVTASLYLLFGAWLAGVDQLVTTNVTPLVVTGFGVAIALRVSTPVASLAYGAQLALAVTMFALSPGRPEAVGSNIVNAVSIAALGWAVSRVLEAGRRHELAQRMRIEEQTDRLTLANRELEALAETDGLTGLLNRRGFLARGAALSAEARARGKASCVVILDADRFKSVNDMHGHAVGDDVLRMIAQICTDAVRTDDLVARLGGEEFALLLPATDLERARRLVESVREAIARGEVVAGDAAVGVTASFGIAELGHADDASLADALERADDALYVAKRAGRNRVELYRAHARDPEEVAQE